MGAVLTRPVEIATSRTRKGVLAGQRITVASNATQGRRPYMEDMVVTRFGKEGTILEDTLFVGVFDGHGGSRVAEFCKDEFLTYIEQNIKVHGKAKELDSEDLEAALKDAFLDLDDKIEGLAPVLVEGTRLLPCLQKGEDYYKDIDHVGSTATTVFVGPETMVIANCGDSRTLLIRNDTVAFSSVDHVPNDVAEIARIENAGGFVDSNRVDGILAVARALGDHRFKANEALPAEQQEVSAVPDVTTFMRTPNDQFLVLASDGLWGVLSNEEVKNVLLELVVKQQLPLDLCCGALVDQACNKNRSGDNVSILIVDLRS